MGEGIILDAIKLLLFVPFIGFLGLLPYANKIEPYILGMPFLLFWVAFWMVMASFILMIVYTIDPDNKGSESE
jgi:O-antigen/teichoic acid export membrane protein